MLQWQITQLIMEEVVFTSVGDFFLTINTHKKQCLSSPCPIPNKLLKLRMTSLANENFAVASEIRPVTIKMIVTS